MSDINNQLYLLQTRDGDYVKDVDAHLSEVIHAHFHFTKNKAEARRFPLSELANPQSVHGVMEEFIKGFAGGKIIPVDK